MTLYRAVTHHTDGVIPCVTVMHATGDEATEFATRSAIATRLDLFWQEIKVVMSTSWAVDNFELSELDGSNYEVFVPPVAIVGSLAGEVLPHQTQGTITWYTDTRGKSFRGRTFLPAGPEAENSAGGVPVSGYTEALQDAANLMDQVFGATNSCRFVVRSELLDVVNNITRGVARDTWSVLRSRRK